MSNRIPGSSSDLQPHGQYGAYYIDDLVTRTIQHGLSLDVEDAIDAKDKLKYALIEGLHELYDSQSQEHFDHILEVARIVDQYFLQGWLTHTHRRPSGRELPYLRITIQDGNENCEDSCSSFRVGVQNDNVGSLPVVDVDIEAAGAWTIGQIVEMLIHEMVHGYLLLFSCRGGSYQEFGGCSRYSHDNRGRHGRHSRTLLKHIYESIQGWDDTLGGFGEDFIDGCDQARQDHVLVDVRDLYS
ncbi:uncharacterized protein LY79DRAFT_647203 [Colletotrichum navitas]|uniref:SprT-like domain-containing protein n=1 Tax=Colletotrichum navitas TaxID=681940 RepID=A0AAD8Q9C0_9PEZI|nr:uncharacterized protein LY79DRAFT_647203 [Colletotrichum navitas]KAK1597417.1 hypothetical protein LY79DRAFT_647203 [Colletotrichum navitas]